MKKRTLLTILKDGYTSLSKKIGTAEDITSQMATQKVSITNLYPVVEGIFDSQSLGKDVVTIPINDSFKEGRTIKSLEDEDRKTFNEYYIEVDEKIKLGLVYAGIYGGAYLVISSKSQTLNDELGIRQDGLENIFVLDPTQLVAMDVGGSPLSENYLKPDYYTSTYGDTVHTSRVIYIDGEVCSNATREVNQGLGLSKYERIASEIQNLSIGNNRALNILSVMHQDVIAIDGLNEALTTDEGEDAIHERLTILNQFKSVLSTLAIDGKDSYSNVSRSLSGVKDVIEVQMMLLSSASRIPMTKLFGKSPDGQNATGKSDLTNYYDDLMSNLLKGKIAKIYSKLDPIVSMHLFGKDEVIDYEFIPLYALNEIEIADIAKKEADTHKIYIDSGVVSELDILKVLQSQGKFENIGIEDDFDENGNLNE